MELMDTRTTNQAIVREPLLFEIPLVDLLFEAEKKWERKIAGLILIQPRSTIETILETKIEPERDQEVKAFWGRVKRETPEILSLSDIDALRIVNGHIKDHKLFWGWFNELGQQAEYGDAKTVLTDLRALRLARAGAQYVLRKEMLRRTLDGWL